MEAPGAAAELSSLRHLINCIPQLNLQTHFLESPWKKLNFKFFFISELVFIARQHSNADARY